MTADHDLGGCDCALIARVRADERAKWLKWAAKNACCEAGLVASPDPCPWHPDGVRERIAQPIDEAYDAAKAMWRTNGEQYWEGRMDALDYAARIIEGEQPAQYAPSGLDEFADTPTHNQ